MPGSEGHAGASASMSAMSLASAKYARQSPLAVWSIRRSAPLTVTSGSASPLLASPIESSRMITSMMFPSPSMLPGLCPSADTYRCGLVVVTSANVGSVPGMAKVSPPATMIAISAMPADFLQFPLCMIRFLGKNPL